MDRGIMLLKIVCVKIAIFYYNKLSTPYLQWRVRQKKKKIKKLSLEFCAKHNLQPPGESEV